MADSFFPFFCAASDEDELRATIAIPCSIGHNIAARAKIKNDVGKSFRTTAGAPQEMLSLQYYLIY